MVPPHTAEETSQVVPTTTEQTALPMAGTTEVRQTEVEVTAVEEVGVAVEVEIRRHCPNPSPNEAVEKPHSEHLIQNGVFLQPR